MWTYFILLLSGVVVLAVFGRKTYLYFKKDEPVVEAVEKAPEEEEEKVKIKKSDREEVEELVKKGEFMLKTGKEDEAIKFFVQALAIDSVHTEAQHKLAMLYMKKEMFSSASALFESLAKASDDAVHYSHLGLAFYNQHLFIEAKGAYQKAVEIDSSRPQRFVSLSQVYKSLGELHNSAIALNKAIEIDNENTSFLLLLADLQREMGNTEEALEIVGRILELDPENEDAVELKKTLATLPQPPLQP